jgi:drug/metabolite transporter (DMT)-like permease
MSFSTVLSEVIVSNLHLLFPLFSSITFVFGMMYARKAIGRGASAWSGTFYGNLWLGLGWLLVGIYRWDVMPVADWWQAAIIGLLFFSGQFFTYTAFRYGDVSVATPIFGVKILIVAVLSSFTTGQSIAWTIWAAAFIATAGVILVQSGPKFAQKHERRQLIITVVTALLAALSLSVFDVLLTTWGKKFGALQFLPVMFVFASLFSFGLLPWVNGVAKLKSVHALRPMFFATILMALQAMGMTIALSQFADATRVNIVYALRGLWAIVFAWLLAYSFEGGERHATTSIMLRRAAGAFLLTAAVVMALFK